MSNNDLNGKEWTLKQELQKRKTQQILRDIQAKQGPLTLYSGQPYGHETPPSESQISRPPQVTTLSLVKARMSRSGLRPSTTRLGVLSVAKRRKIIAVVSAAAILLVCFIVTLIVSPQVPTLAALPRVSIAQAVNYLKQGGVPIADLKQLAVPSQTWHANEGVQFSTSEGNSKATFIILSYDSPGHASLDAFKASHTEPFRKWTLSQIANVLVLTSPNSPHNLQADLTKRLTRGFIAPYRSWLNR
jgi:hypothetical protein